MGLPKYWIRKRSNGEEYVVDERGQEVKFPEKARMAEHQPLSGHNIVEASSPPPGLRWVQVRDPKQLLREQEHRGRLEEAARALGLSEAEAKTFANPYRRTFDLFT